MELLPGMDPKATTIRFIAPLLCLLAGCASPPDRPAQPASIDEAVEWIGTLQLEETDSSLVALPNLRSDPMGGWLYWDPQESQARRYDVDGKLLSVIGHSGNGPGEFSRLMGLVRLSSGQLATIDFDGTVAIWTDSGELANTIESNLIALWGAAALPDGRIGIMTRPNPTGPDLPGSPVIHGLTLPTEALVSAPFTPSVTPEEMVAVVTVQSPPPRVIGDSIYFSFGALDTIWALPTSLQGDGRAMAVHSELMAQNPPSPPPGGTVDRAVREWLEGSTFLGEFDRLSDGRWLIATWGQREGDFLQGLVLLSAEGDRIWELQGAPRLLEVDDQDRLYFSNPDDLDPALIRIARLR